MTQKTSEQVITLLPYPNSSSSVISLWITSLPSLGALYQTSSNFETFGYAPTRNIQITTTPTLVTSSTNRVVYLPPANFAFNSFTYQGSTA